MTANLYKLSNNPVREAAFSFEIVLYQQADTKLIQTSVTLIAGDVVVYKDGVLDGNIDALPVEIGTSGILTVTLSVDEMTADRIAIKFSDAAGAQWCSAMVFLSTVQAVAVGTSDLTAALVWEYATRTLTSFGTLIADIWSYVIRTLTQSAAEAAESTNPGTLALKRGDTWSQSITELGSLVGYTYIDFTVKHSEDDLDTDAIIQIRKAASGSGDGLLVLNGAEGTAADGSITIDDETLGDITIALAATSTDDLELDKGLYYDIQKITGTAVLTMGSGILNVTSDITRAVT